MNSRIYSNTVPTMVMNYTIATILIFIYYLEYITKTDYHNIHTSRKQSTSRVISLWHVTYRAGSNGGKTCE